MPEAVAVNVKNRSHAITADVVVPDDGAEGVLISQGSLLGGWVLFAREGRLVYEHNLCNWEHHRVEADSALAPGSPQRVVRGGYWRQALDVFEEHPAVGRGAGSFGLASLRHRELGVGSVHAHGFLACRCVVVHGSHRRRRSEKCRLRR